jgi:hypothetical protein
MRSRAVCERGDCAEISGEAEAGGARAAEGVGQAEVQRQDPLCAAEGEPAAMMMSSRNYEARPSSSDAGACWFSSPNPDENVVCACAASLFHKHCYVLSGPSVR